MRARCTNGFSAEPSRGENRTVDTDEEQGPAKGTAGSECSDDVPSNSTLLTIPTVLTVLRVCAIPPVIYLVQFQEPSAAMWAATVFIAASVTDWLDGYLARKLKSSTSFGAFLDPVADKLMVCSVLVLLCTKTFATGLFATAPWLLHGLAVAIVCREVAMSALREHAASLGAAAQSVVAVNKLGKYKTALQLVSLSMLLISMNGGDGQLVQIGATVGPWALILATLLTWQSFTAYFLALWKFMT